MEARSTRVRTKVVALLVSMAALWAFAAFVTVREGLNLLWLVSLDANVGQPVEQLVDSLQQERRASLVYLGERGTSPQHRADLAAARGRTDTAAARFARLAQGSSVRRAETPLQHNRIADAVASLRTLAATRTDIDGGAASRTETFNRFTTLVATHFLVYTSLSSLDDPGVAKEGRALIGLSQAREALSQEDAMLAGALAAGRVDAGESQRFVQLVGLQRYLRDQAASDLPADDLGLYRSLVNDAPFSRLVAVENAFMEKPLAATVPAATWQSVAQPALDGLRDLILRATKLAISHASGPAAWVIIRLVLATGLGLIAVIASVVISVTTARSLVRQLHRLRTAAAALADHRLPAVVDRLRRGEAVDVAAEAPPLEFGDDEIGQVGQAFNRVQETAVRAAVEQAELRRGVRDVFLSLARRSQALIHRQLGLLDAMERRATDAEELEDLFKLDHLATRMRRNAENLIVLSGATAGRGWRNPVGMIDVVRGALAEVEDYTRVTVLPIEPAALAGRAVGDVIHLLAELIENAVSFSPPYTMVHVNGQLVGNGFVVEIEDRGLGMTGADLAAANEQLRRPPEFNLSSTARLGLFVVGRLAQRHGIRVNLRESPYGGTTAIVLIPTALVAQARPGGHVIGRRPEQPALSAEPAGTVDGTAVPGTPAAGTEPDTQPDTQPGTEPDTQPGTGAAVPVPEAGPLPPQGAGWPPAGRPASAVPPAPAEPVTLVSGPGSCTGAAGTDAAGVPATVGRRTGSPRHSSPAPAPVDVPAIAPASTAPASTAPATSAAQTPAEPTLFTSAGLPWRVRQASIAAPLAEAPDPDPVAVAEPRAREPEEIRRMMSAYQRGTNRGRAQAARDAGEPAGAPTPAEVDPDRNGTGPHGTAERGRT